MSIKRKDTKGRILKDGESQRPDGRYMYQYVDAYGKRQTLYSWRLVETDSTPKGKRDTISLRVLFGKLHAAKFLHFKQIKRRY